MCYFIKLVLPAEADVAALRVIMERHGRVLGAISEPRVDRALPAGHQAYLTTRGCDCGTGLSSRASGRREHDADRDLARLRRQGWSEAKIQRWCEQRGSAIARRAEVKERSRAQEVEAWRALLSQLLDTGLDHLGLSVHWATDELHGGPVVPRERLSAETLSNLDENVLYTFTRRPS